MELQQLIYDETLKWARESGFTPKTFNDDLCIQLHDLSQWVDGSHNAKNRFKGSLKDCPEFGDPEQDLIFIRYLPYFLVRYNPRDAQVRNKIRGLLERFGFTSPDPPIHKVYFIKFQDKEDGEIYCKIGSTTTSIETRLNSSRQQIGKLAVDGKVDLIGVIETNKANVLESVIQEHFSQYRVEKYKNQSTVGKEEIYKLPESSRRLIDDLKNKFCETRSDT